MKSLLLAIDPGSTSTKFSLYSGEQPLYMENIHHPNHELGVFLSIAGQAEYRLQMITSHLQTHGFYLDKLEAVVGRGGFLHPLQSGVYQVNQAMVTDLQTAKYGEHASNLGGILAYTLAQSLHIPAYIVDPIVVDELDDLARLSGIPEIQRKSYVHALNIRSVARLVAQSLGKSMAECSFVVAHLGSGISVVAMKNGRMVDVSNANSGGPYSVERAGGLPTFELVKLCYSRRYTEKELLQRITKEGGMYAYLATKDLQQVEQRIAAGDDYATLILEGMVYQIGKEIAAMAAVLEGKMDRIILTGGMAHSEWLVSRLTRKVSFLAPVEVFPGEHELVALAQSVLRVLRGQEQAQTYARLVPQSLRDLSHQLLP